MSAGSHRTLEAFYADAVLVLAPIARAWGMTKLRGDKSLNRVVNIVGTMAVEKAVDEVVAVPNEAEIEVLASRALELLRDYAMIKARASASKAQVVLPLDPPAPVAPNAPITPITPSEPYQSPPLPPAPQPQNPPPVRYSMPMLIDPLFVREMTKPPPGPKPRDITSVEAVGKILGRQTDAIAAFFVSSETAETVNVVAKSGPAWTAHFELGASLCIVADCFIGLPGFVKTLDIVSGEQKTPVLASNLRTGRTRIDVSPSAHEYRFFAGTYDDEVGVDLAPLTLPGFTTARATAFRVDGTGEGKILTGAILSPGRTYRILVPPGFDALELAGSSGKELAGGWFQFEFTLPRPVPSDLTERLLRLGLATGKTTLDVDFVGITAREYREGRGGERYACFRPDDVFVVSIGGVETRASGELVVFLVGPAGQSSISLPVGRDFLVKVGPLPEGRYALDVLSVDMTREPERLLFEVDARAGSARAMLVAQAALTLGNERMVIDGDVFRIVDLSELDEEKTRIEVPPLFRIGARWEGERSRLLSPLFADGAGVVPMSDLFGQLGDERVFTYLGELSLDFGEFGRVVLRHQPWPQADWVWEKLSALFTERVRVAKTTIDPLLMRTAWIEPVCRLLRYRLEPIPPLHENVLQSPLQQCLTFMLDTVVYADHGIKMERRAVLIVCPRGTELAAEQPDNMRDMAAQLARRDGLTRVFLTDGLSWALCEPGRVYQRPPMNIVTLLEDETGAPAVLNEMTLARFEEFLYQFHA